MPLARTIAAWCALVGAAAGLAAWGVQLTMPGWDAARALPAASPATAPRLLVGLAGVGLVLAAAWLVVVLAVSGADLALGRCHVTSRGLWRPRFVRSLVLRLCVPSLGAALACGVAAPATAGSQPAPGPGGAHRPGAVTARLSGLPLPVRPLDPAPVRAVGARPTAQPSTVLAAGPRHPRLHVVRPGESLWSIAEDLLGPRAASRAVDRAWRAVYRRNLDGVGPDPDVLLPGTRLALPVDLPGPQRPTRSPRAAH